MAGVAHDVCSIAYSANGDRLMSKLIGGLHILWEEKSSLR